MRSLPDCAAPPRPGDRVTVAGDTLELAALAAAVPFSVRRVCERLEEAGHQAVTVGGAVRDALLGRAAGDWDVATSAKPDQVIALFRHTVPTGLAHGTVTVLTRSIARLQPHEVDHIEVTTFRGEGAYSDGRRPDQVHFGVPLEEDLARRDLVVNAIAYSPTDHLLIDPFGGREDLRLRRLRAVGVPLQRFLEDGLRVMRAIRFAAVLEFSLDSETEEALEPALPALARVSKERICIELTKLLAAPRPSLGLEIAFRRGIVALVLPEIERALAQSGRTSQQLCRRVDAAPLPARLPSLVFDIGAAAGSRALPDNAVHKQIEAMLRQLKMKNADCEQAGQVTAVAAAVLAQPALDDLAVRRLLAAIGRRHAAVAVATWRADGAALAGDVGSQLADVGEKILQRGDALAVSELALTGGDLMAELGVPAGAEIGRVLRALLDRVLRDPSLNMRAALLNLARDLFHPG